MAGPHSGSAAIDVPLDAGPNPLELTSNQHHGGGGGGGGSGLFGGWGSSFFSKVVEKTKVSDDIRIAGFYTLFSTKLAEIMRIKCIHVQK